MFLNISRLKLDNMRLYTMLQDVEDDYYPYPTRPVDIPKYNNFFL